KARSELADGALPRSEHLDDTPPRRVGERGESVHARALPRPAGTVAGEDGGERHAVFRCRQKVTNQRQEFFRLDIEKEVAGVGNDCQVRVRERRERFDDRTESDPVAISRCNEDWSAHRSQLVVREVGWFDLADLTPDRRPVRRIWGDAAIALALKCKRVVIVIQAFQPREKFRLVRAMLKGRPVGGDPANLVWIAQGERHRGRPAGALPEDVCTLDADRIEKPRNVVGVPTETQRPSRKVWSSSVPLNVHRNDPPHGCELREFVMKTIAVAYAAMAKLWRDVHERIAGAVHFVVH